MGKLAVIKYFAFMMLVISIIVMVATFVGIFGGNSTPAGNTSSAMLVYALPILIILNIILLIYWAIRRKLFAIMPLVSLLACIPYAGTMVQLGLFGGGGDASQKTLKVCSYNVAHFNHDVSGFIAQDILSELKKQKVDVFCVQEYLGESGEQNNNETFKEYLPYSAKGKEDMLIFSKYPIVTSESFPFEDTNNSFMWADINVDGKICRVFNVHLETTGFNSMLHRASKITKRGGNVESNALLRAIYQNYTVGMVTRAEQAEMVAHERDASTHPVIIAGDFNDVPYSYVYKTVKGDLNDGFREGGKGFMYTFRGGKKMVRIDYIFADKSLKGIDYYKTGLTYSDHFPIFMQMQL